MQYACSPSVNVVEKQNEIRLQIYSLLWVIITRQKAYVTTMLPETAYIHQPHDSLTLTCNVYILHFGQVARSVSYSCVYCKQITSAKTVEIWHAANDQDSIIWH
jgi:hypothetical protein